MADKEPTVYAVRQSNRVASRIEAEHQRQEGQHGAAVADEWEDALTEAVASLATYPKRCSKADENGPFQRVSADEILYVLLFRHRRGVTWRILFTVHEADANDPPTVKVQHIRHGAQAPMTSWPDEDE